KKKPKKRISKTKIKKAYILDGQLKLLRVRKMSSKDYILNANTEIIEGDFAGILKNDSASGSLAGSESDDLILE
ncbi:MAG: hypothetical protein ACK5V3_02595, partial [Bdellovibrionales bacterium]